MWPPANSIAPTLAQMSIFESDELLTRINSKTVAMS
jgi:hypothetical protein